jgi:prevent-host-death family protein
MIKIVTLTEAKAKLSELISRVVVRKEKIAITRKGKPAAIILPIEEYKSLGTQYKGGLFHAKGSLAGLDEELDQMTELIYENREKEISRKVPL